MRKIRKFEELLGQPTYNSFGEINEASLSRLISKIKIEQCDFIIISAFRGENTLKRNEQLNSELLKTINDLKMGAYLLNGFWKKAPEEMDWDLVNRDKPELLELKEENSFLIIRRKDISIDDFKKITIDLIAKCSQDCAVFSTAGDISFLFPDAKMELFANRVTLEKMGEAYSNMKKGTAKTPFVFEGAKMPTGNLGKQSFALHGLLYY